MKTEQLLAEIRDLNLTYLILAQQMIVRDKAQALFRLGISEPVADLLAGLTAGQIPKIAASNMLICQFRFDEQMVWDLLTSHSRDAARNSVSGSHAAILMAAKIPQAA